MYKSHNISHVKSYNTSQKTTTCTKCNNKDDTTNSHNTSYKTLNATELAQYIELVKNAPLNQSKKALIKQKIKNKTYLCNDKLNKLAEIILKKF